MDKKITTYSTASFDNSDTKVVGVKSGQVKLVELGDAAEHDASEFAASSHTHSDMVKKVSVNGTEYSPNNGVVSFNTPTVTIDNALSDLSENPVQNKVIKEALDNKADEEPVYDVTLVLGLEAQDIIGQNTAILHNLTVTSVTYEDDTMPDCDTCKLNVSYTVHLLWHQRNKDVERDILGTCAGRFMRIFYMHSDPLDMDVYFENIEFLMPLMETYYKAEISGIGLAGLYMAHCSYVGDGDVYMKIASQFDQAFQDMISYVDDEVGGVEDDITITSLSVNSTTVTPDANKNVNIVVPQVYNFL